jgi:hypothetical protein
VLDFESSTIIVKHNKFDKDSDSNTKKMTFRDILDCYLPKEEYEALMRRDAHDDFPHPFLLKTHDRIYELYASLK